MSLIMSVAIGSGWTGMAGGQTRRRSRLPTLYAMTPKSRRTHSSHSFGELAFLDEAPACALRSATVVARTGNAEDVADHHVVMPRNVLPQLPDLPERALAENDFAFIDYLWDYWASPGYRDSEHIAEIKRMLKGPGVLTATLGYYRALFDPRKVDPGLENLRHSMDRPITVPTLAV